MAVVCVFVPDYKIAVARLERPDLGDVPLMIADRLERGHIVALDRAAYALGARRDMTLVQAAACAREAEILVDDAQRNRLHWDALLDALDAASPLIEDAAEGTAFLDMRGIAAHAASDAERARRWLAAVRAAAAGPSAGLALHVALGPNKFTARAAAAAQAENGSFADDGVAVPDGTQRTFLAPLPLRFLDVDRATLERLELLGIRTLGELAALPHGPFVRRFGPAAAQWHRFARGIDERPLVPRARQLRIDRSLYGEGTAEREDQLLFALRTLVARIAEDVAFAGKRCGLARLTLECEDATLHEIVTVLAQPTAQAATIFDLLRARLEGTVLHAPVVGLRLGAERLEEGGTELSLFAGGDPDPEIVAIAVERLHAALGPDAAQRTSATDGHRYEARAAYAPFHFTRRMAPATPRENAGTATLAYRLIEPRAVAVAFERGVLARVDGRKVLEAAGPWRTSEAWWDEALDAGSRHQSDCYDVFLDDGTLYRIARDAAARWTICGMYD